MLNLKESISLEERNGSILAHLQVFQKYENPANPYNRKPHRKALDKCSNNRPT